MQFKEVECQNYFYQKFGFDEKNLRKNNLVLEEVILKRMQKRENQQIKNKALLTQPPKLLKIEVAITKDEPNQAINVQNMDKNEIYINSDINGLN